MKQVIYIDKPKNEEKKPVEFTHFMNGSSGYEKSTDNPRNYEKVFYLGNCKIDGDMFACFRDGYIEILKGHLNSGYYE